MKTPHKYAALIKAWADGAEIEFFSDANACWMLNPNPRWVDDFEYRIKPEPKPDVVVVGKLVWDGLSISNAAYHTEFHVTEHYGKSNIKATFDGGTGALKDVEILK